MTCMPSGLELDLVFLLAKTRALTLIWLHLIDSLIGEQLDIFFRARVNTIFMTDVTFLESFVALSWRNVVKLAIFLLL